MSEVKPIPTYILTRQALREIARLANTPGILNEPVDLALIGVWVGDQLDMATTEAPETRDASVIKAWARETFTVGCKDRTKEAVRKLLIEACKKGAGSGNPFLAEAMITFRAVEVE